MQLKASNALLCAVSEGLKIVAETTGYVDEASGGWSGPVAWIRKECSTAEARLIAAA